MPLDDVVRLVNPLLPAGTIELPPPIIFTRESKLAFGPL